MPRLSGASARLCFKVRDFIREDLALDLRGQSLLAAFSHGADSTALLAVLEFLREDLGCAFSAMHIDHALRPQSAAEAQKAAAFCRERGIACTLARADAAALARELKTGLEDAGRRLRRKLLEEERARIGADWIVTAHHLDDLGEDLLLRLLRGAGWPALAGMRALDSGRKILRPLLLVESHELKLLLEELNLPWVEDESNRSRHFKRNRLRHGVMPLLKEENPSLGRKTAALWRMARDDEEHWRRHLDAALAERPARRSAHETVLPKKLLAGLDRAGRMRLYARIIYEFNAGQPLAETLFQMDEAWRAGRGGTVFQLPGGLTAGVLRGEIKFTLVSRQATIEHFNIEML